MIMGQKAHPCGIGLVVTSVPKLPIWKAFHFKEIF